MNSRKQKLGYTLAGLTISAIAVGAAAPIWQDNHEGTTAGSGKSGIAQQESANSKSLGDSNVSSIMQPDALWSSFGHRVRCDHGASLAKAVRYAWPGKTLVISGTCLESVEIKTDRLTLRGLAGAVIDGSSKPSEAVIHVKGATGITLENLTVQNGADQGILASHQAQVFLKDMVANNNGTIGVSVDRSHLDVTGLVMDGNGTGGMDAYTSSTVVLHGDIQATNNGGDGLVANGKTFLELRGAAVNASNNAGNGVSSINDSRVQIFSFPEAQGSTITADSNGFAGIGLMGAELGVVGAEFFGSGANVITATNNVFGFFMPAGAILSPHATGKFVAENNFIGMLIEDGGSLLVIGGLGVSQNSVGIAASGAGTLTMVSVPPNPSTVDANQTDMSLGFGTRATINGVAVTTLVCDGTALVRGSVACP